MSRTYIEGKDMLIYLWPDGDEPLIAGCNTTDSFNLDREYVEVTPASGQFRAYLPTYIGGSMAFDSVVFFEGVSDANTGLNRHLNWIINRTALNFQIRWTDGTLTDGIDGQCYLQSLSITGAVDEFSTGNINLLISGEFTQYESPS